LDGDGIVVPELFAGEFRVIVLAAVFAVAVNLAKSPWSSHVVGTVS
jgi:hypothetical protein